MPNPPQKRDNTPPSQKIRLESPPFISYKQSKNKTKQNKKKSPSNLISLPNNPFTIHPPHLNTNKKNHSPYAHTHTQK